MDKVISLPEAFKVSKKLKSDGKTIVLAGGCFDILHLGHVEFLRKAKETGDILMVLLESDENVRRIKGENHPINNQEDRAKVLAALSVVDWIVTLPRPFNNQDYDQTIIEIRPEILATTKGDPQRKHKERQARLIAAKVIDVVGRIKNQSTTRLAQLLKEEYGL